MFIPFYTFSIKMFYHVSIFWRHKFKRGGIILKKVLFYEKHGHIY